MGNRAKKDVIALWSCFLVDFRKVLGYTLACDSCRPDNVRSSILQNALALRFNELYTYWRQRQ